MDFFLFRLHFSHLLFVPLAAVILDAAYFSAERKQKQAFPAKNKTRVMERPEKEPSPRLDGETVDDNCENDDITPKNDLEASAGISKTKSAQDPYVVDWDGPNDPHNPFNWTTYKKIRQMIGMAFNTFLT